ncbi:MAG: prepilin peptidase [Planctomycetaceae bacterium]|jgi:prepilin signal peptidase PulO-like enzyme (type II secretory pathway)|nr:prepilin peptidase [Planctomycetaceae bacterium]
MIAADIFCFILVIVAGCCVGSFLNVVIYRLPHGDSISYPPSHCPKCKSPIRPYDNIPVLGWILLGGRCRDCREPISLRYPIVEAVAGLIAGSIAIGMFKSFSELSHFDLVIGTLYYFSLIVTLLAAGLIEFDQNKIPIKLFVPITIITPIVSYYFNQHGLHTKLNNSDLFLTITTIIISCIVMIVGFQFYSSDDNIVLRRSKIRKYKKSKLRKRLKFEFSLRIFIPLLTAVIISVGCGIITIPLLFCVTIIAVIFLHYRKELRLYLLLTGAVWTIIVYVLLGF